MGFFKRDFLPRSSLGSQEDEAEGAELSRQPVPPTPAVKVPSLEWGTVDDTGGPYPARVAHGRAPSWCRAPWVLAMCSGSWPPETHQRASVPGSPPWATCADPSPDPWQLSMCVRWPWLCLFQNVLYMCGLCEALCVSVHPAPGELSS